MWYRGATERSRWLWRCPATGTTITIDARRRSGEIRNRQGDVLAVTGPEGWIIVRPFGIDLVEEATYEAEALIWRPRPLRGAKVVWELLLKLAETLGPH